MLSFREKADAYRKAVTMAPKRLEAQAQELAKAKVRVESESVARTEAEQRARSEAEARAKAEQSLQAETQTLARIEAETEQALSTARAELEEKTALHAAVVREFEDEIRRQSEATVRLEERLHSEIDLRGQSRSRGGSGPCRRQGAGRGTGQIVRCSDTRPGEAA